jgi:hypothetical protein
MIKDLTNALRTLIASLSLRPLATLLALFLIAITYISVRSYDTIQKIVITPVEEAHHFNRGLRKAQLVNSAIENLRIDLKAQNVIIKQFHNGRHDLTGLPFTEASITFSTSGSLAKQEHIASMNTSLRKMWASIDAPECIVQHSALDASTRAYMEEYSLAAVVSCPLTNPLNYPIGVLLVGFVEPEEPTNAVAETSSVAKRIVGYLND